VFLSSIPYLENIISSVSHTYNHYERILLNIHLEIQIYVIRKFNFFPKYEISLHNSLGCSNSRQHYLWNFFASLYWRPFFFSAILPSFNQSNRSLVSLVQYTFIAIVPKIKLFYNCLQLTIQSHLIKHFFFNRMNLSFSA